MLHDSISVYYTVQAKLIRKWQNCDILRRYASKFFKIVNWNSVLGTIACIITSYSKQPSLIFAKLKQAEIKQNGLDVVQIRGHGDFWIVIGKRDLVHKNILRCGVKYIILDLSTSIIQRVGRGLARHRFGESNWPSLVVRVPYLINTWPQPSFFTRDLFVWCLP